MRDLTARQREVLRYIVSYAIANGGPPSVREMCKALGGVHLNAMNCLVQRITAKGYVSREWMEARGLRVAGLETRIADTPEGARLREAIAASPVPGQPDPGASQDGGAAGV